MGAKLKADHCYPCAACGREVPYAEAWVPDDLEDRRRYCGGCAPDDAIRLKDIAEPRPLTGLLNEGLDDAS